MIILLGNEQFLIEKPAEKEVINNFKIIKKLYNNKKIKLDK